MKALLLGITCIFISLVVKSQQVLDKKYTDQNNGFVIDYPGAWKVDTKPTEDYLVRFSDPSQVGFIHVQKTIFKNSADARKIITESIVPAWQKAGAVVINQPESVRTVTTEQLLMKNATSGYSVLMRQNNGSGVLYVGYILLTKANVIYEIKYEGSEKTPAEIVKTLPKIGYSLKLL